MKKFPCGTFGHQKLTFFSAPQKTPLRAFAGLVFPWIEERVVVCNIADRGWCIPSGRVEPGESSVEAVRREALEEGGIELIQIQYIGFYKIETRDEAKYADCFTARVSKTLEIGMKNESLGRKLVSIDQLPGLYHLWNDLTEQVFHHALAITKRCDAFSDGECPPCEFEEC